ncbi:MAG: DUF2259 domain-containing protein [Bdellovibrionales bacterium]|nr:DUF2259 domain-containing protein [Bdellovibrionales bacterium]
MKKTILTLGLLASSLTHAMDTKNFHNLGFSKNQKYFAFADSVVQDGSGFPLADVYVVNTAKNTITKHTRVMIEDDSSFDENEALQKAIAKADLTKNGIIAGQNLGVATPASEQSPLRLPLTANGRDYTIELKQLPAGTLNPNCIEDLEDQMIEVSLESSSQKITLQKDQRQPKSRECSYDYRIDRALVNGKSLVVVLSYQTFGFEGPDTNHMVVTGTLP